LLVNYWKNKTAGEIFTPILPQEHLYMQQLEQLMHKTRFITRGNITISDISMNGNVNSPNAFVNNQPLSQLREYFPFERIVIEVKIERDFLSHFISWMNQIIPPDIANFLEDNSHLQALHCSYIIQFASLAELSSILREMYCSEGSDFARDSPVILLTYGQNTAKDIANSEGNRHVVYQNWPKWNLNTQTSFVSLTTLDTTAEAQKLWKESLPGYDGDEE
jgi:hypothetical protein